MKRIVKADPDLAVRIGPGTEYRAVTRIRKGAAVEVLDQNPKGGPWVYIAAPAGWVHGDYLTDGAVAAVPRGNGWRLAGALAQLLHQVNGWAPGRGKAKDGTIGDEAHQQRASDHNRNAAGVVTALDITHDPAHGCDCQILARSLVASRDPRIKYVIWNRTMWRSYDRPKTATRPFLAAWMPEPYTGANPHDQHIHVSVGATPNLYDDTRPWSVVTK